MGIYRCLKSPPLGWLCLHLCWSDSASSSLAPILFCLCVSSSLLSGRAWIVSSILHVLFQIMPSSFSSKICRTKQFHFSSSLIKSWILDGESPDIKYSHAKWFTHSLWCSTKIKSIVTVFRIIFPIWKRLKPER